MSVGNAYEGKVLKAVFGDTHSAEIPNTVYVALHSADPTEAGGSELTGGSYARVAVANTTANWAESGGVMSNVNEVAFPTATADWTQATHFSVHGHITNNDMIVYGALATARTVLNGQTLRFPAGAIDITCD